VTNPLLGSLLGSLLGGGSQTQQQANTQGYAQALAQAQNYQSQSPTALAQAYSSAGGGFHSQSIASMLQGQQNATIRREGTIVGDVFPPATRMDLDHDAYETPVATLIDLWVARFGNEWIDLETVDDDKFFSLAYQRLKNLGQLEIHYLTDRARYVCRKPK
jgi:hypothetical protein